MVVCKKKKSLAKAQFDTPTRLSMFREERENNPFCKEKMV
jgi:hypothetical protein